MLSDACFDLSNALREAQAAQSLTVALVSFETELEHYGTAPFQYPEAVLTALQHGLTAVRGGALSAKAFAAMADTVREHFDNPNPLALNQLLVDLSNWHR